MTDITNTDKYYEFRIAFRSSALLDEEPENYLTSIKGDILFSDDSDVERTVGKLRLFYIDVDEAVAHGYGIHTILDFRAETEPFFSVLFNGENGDFKDSIYQLAGEDVWGRNLLIIDRLEILPPFRGKDLGLACLNRCIQQHCHGAGLVALKCFPLQFESGTASDEWRSQLKLDELGKKQSVCQARLMKYYGLLGFERIKRTEFMILNPNNSLRSVPGHF